MSVSKKLKKRKLIAVVEVPGEGDKVKHLDRSISGVNPELDDQEAFITTRALFKLTSAKVVSIDESTRSEYKDETPGL